MSASCANRAKHSGVLLAATVMGGCAAEAPDLPGSAGFPLVAGSTITDCPEVDRGNNSVCVTMPNNEQGRAIIQSYRSALEERGYTFMTTLGSPNVLLLTRQRPDGCDAMIFGLPYLPPEERSNFLLEFQHHHGSGSDCEAAS